MKLRSLPLLSLLLFSYSICAQPSLTASDIVQRSIDSSGGDKLFDTLHSVEFITKMLTPSKEVISLAIKKKAFSKYYISVLSLGHVNTTTIYNKGKAVIIKNDTVQNITDPRQLEEFQLQCYISIDYAYKKLGYALTRIDDQKFENFDCYVVLAESPLGRKTANYYDKKTGRHIMVIYPSGSKSIFIDHYESAGISAPSNILLTDIKNNMSQSSTQKVIYDNKLDSFWFDQPDTGSHIASEIFKNGKFSYLNSNQGAGFIREGKKHVEIGGGAQTQYIVDWTDNNNYMLIRLKNPALPSTNENIEYFKVRIINWTGNKYYCQYLTSENIGGTCAFEKIN
jgi:hypothetical protein